MELTNEQRKFFGLELVDPSWDRVEIPAVNGYNTIHPEKLKSDRKNVLYFDGDFLRKEISQHENGGFRESSYNLRTQDNRTMIAPITAAPATNKKSSAGPLRISIYLSSITAAVSMFALSLAISIKPQNKLAKLSAEATITPFFSLSMTNPIITILGESLKILDLSTINGVLVTTVSPGTQRAVSQGANTSI